MFTWNELIGMGIRQKGYWLRQADAIRRQLISVISYGVRIGMAESSDYEKAIDSLELGLVEKKDEGLSPVWSQLLFLKGGKGV